MVVSRQKSPMDSRPGGSLSMCRDQRKRNTFLMVSVIHQIKVKHFDFYVGLQIKCGELVESLA